MQPHRLRKRPSEEAAPEAAEQDQTGEPEAALDQTESVLLKNAATKADKLVSSVVGTSVGVAAAAVSGDSVAAVTEAAKAMGGKVATSDALKTGIANGATMVAGVAAVANGDAFAAAAATKAVLENAPAALAPLAVVADVVMLAKGDKKLKDKAQAAAKEVETLTSPVASPVKKTKSALDLATHAQGGITLGKELIAAWSSIGTFAARSRTLAPTVKALGRGVDWLMKTPVGSIFRGLGKALPFLNVAALANSVWIGYDVFKAKESSTTTRALAVGSIVSSAGLFLATVSAAFAPMLLPMALGGLVVELSLFYARRNDQQAGDTDRKLGYALSHPVEGAELAARTAMKGIDATLDWFALNLRQGVDKLGDLFKGKKPSPDA
ncbi:MAG TPA: hypothetical protein V6D00_14720 [Pantanalinema sp.]